MAQLLKRYGSVFKIGNKVGKDTAGCGCTDCGDEPCIPCCFPDGSCENVCGDKAPEDCVRAGGEPAAAFGFTCADIECPTDPGGGDCICVNCNDCYDSGVIASSYAVDIGVFSYATGNVQPPVVPPAGCEEGCSGSYGPLNFVISRATQPDPCPSLGSSTYDDPVACNFTAALDEPPLLFGFSASSPSSNVDCSDGSPSFEGSDFSQMLVTLSCNFDINGDGVAEAYPTQPPGHFVMEIAVCHGYRCLPGTSATCGLCGTATYLQRTSACEAGETPVGTYDLVNVVTSQQNNECAGGSWDPPATLTVS